MSEVSEKTYIKTGHSAFDKLIPQIKAFLEQDSLDVKAYALLGKSYLALDKPDSSLLSYSHANRIAPENRYYKHQIFILYNRLGDTLYS